MISGMSSGMTAGMTSPRRSPLDGRHRLQGAKLAGFGGWEMPVEYAGGGVLREHAAVRTAVGVFDVSHLGKVEVRGPGAGAYLNRVLTNDLDRAGEGQAQYTLLCAEDGGVVDDLLAYRADADEVLLVPNAANAAEVLRLLRSGAPGGVEVEDRHGAYAVIAVQGPRSDEALTALGLPVGHPYLSFRTGRYAGAPVLVCRTGYTGERGYELLPRAQDAEALWDAALEAAGAYGGLPCGLGARDTLRTEMGYPLHGHELSPEITPVQARLSWAVGWSKPAFRGRDPLLAERAQGPRRLLWGLLALDRGIPRPGMRVVRGGADVGVVTSGTFSPTLKKGIGLALLDRTVGEGEELGIDVRGRTSAVRVVKPPFVRTSLR